jgi:hypothetical protein
MNKEEAEKLVWDFAGLNREVQTLEHWDRRPPKALTAKMEEMAARLVNALLSLPPG